MTTTAVYAANAANAAPLAPLDPGEVQPYEWDWGAAATYGGPYLESGETIAEADVTVTGGAVLLVGDGATAVTTSAGSVTPAAVTIFDSSTQVRAWLYVDPSWTVVEDTVVEVECTIRTSNGRVGSRSISVTVSSR